MATKEQIENYMLATGLCNPEQVAEIIDDEIAEEKRAAAVEVIRVRLESDVYQQENFIEFRDWFNQQVVPILAHLLHEEF